MNGLGEQLIRRFEGNRTLLDALLEGISESHASAFPSPSLNNIVWQVGHVTLTRLHFIKRLLPLDGHGEVMTSDERALFDRGASPPKVSSAYPLLSRLKACFEQAHAPWLGYLQSLKPSDLGAEHGDGTLGDLFGFLLVHESYHLGQVGLLRNYYGYPRVFG